jgi:hypothetical protein
MGYKFQVAAEPLLEEMGCKIIKAEHRPLENLGKRRARLQSYAENLGNYLWNYVDYVVMKRGRLFLIDVKSQGYVPLLQGSKGDPFTPSTVNFTRLEMSEYPSSKAPVLIFLILYHWGGKIQELPPGGLGVKRLVEYSQKLDLTRLGPAFYKLIPFRDFKFREETAGGFLDNKFGGCKKLSSRRIYALLRKTRALDVVEVGLGSLRREQEGQIVTKGLSPS